MNAPEEFALVSLAAKHGYQAIRAQLPNDAHRMVLRQTVYYARSQYLLGFLLTLIPDVGEEERN